jgi:hypothetical protein
VIVNARDRRGRGRYVLTIRWRFGQG